MPNETILIVDDNPLNLKLEKRLLEIEQYQVLTAKNAEETIELLERFHPRLILMDLQLPGMDGMDLTRKIKSDPRNRDAVVLMVTSYDQKGDEARAKKVGCDGYITKPIDTQTFAGIVSSYLKRRSDKTDE